jgi:hypothetical protein
LKSANLAADPALKGVRGTLVCCQDKSQVELGTFCK